MTGASQLVIATQAADALARCGFDCSAEKQWWTDVLASALSGLVHLPLALAFVWGFHRFGLDRWLVMTAALATILSVIVMGILDLFVANIYFFAEQVLHEIGVNRFVYMLIPNLLVCLVGALGFGWWLKQHLHDDKAEASE